MLRLDSYSLRKGFRRISYFLKNIISQYVPDNVYRLWTRYQFARLSNDLKEAAEKRVDYYFRLSPHATLGGEITTVGEFSKYVRSRHKRHSTYCYDLYPIIRLFGKEKKFSYVFGDVNFETSTPAFTKTRPIVREGEFSNCVVMRLNSLRHFVFVNDKKKWTDKKDMLVFRNVVDNKPHRIDFLLKTFHNTLCVSGEIINSTPELPRYVKPYMTMEQLLEYKFIACIEGNDVATNLKWVMSSNSIAVMPRPKFESWFMEATLIPNYHYIEIKDDYSDITEKLTYYLSHPDEAKAIIQHANEYVNQFKNKRLERWIQYEVAKRYFLQTNTPPSAPQQRSEL